MVWVCCSGYNVVFFIRFTAAGLSMLWGMMLPAKGWRLPVVGSNAERGL